MKMRRGEMSDDTDGTLPGEEEETEESAGITIDMGDTPPVYVLEGQNYSVLFANPSHVAHPFHWIKDCVGCTVFSKQGSQAKDEVRYIVKVGDGFEERELSEVYHHESTKVYEPTKKLKVVH
jgi:hypothetical protein